MHAVQTTEESTSVTTDDGKDIAAWRERMHMTIDELAKEAKVDPDTLSKWEQGKRKPQPRTRKAVLAALDRLKEEEGYNAPPAAAEDFVEFRIEGVMGVKAIVVKGPVKDVEQFENSIARIIRQVAQGETPADNGQG
jgi:transcriptional regulator with XRE-family HTH domain